jgi:hypothetical protein
LIKKNRNQKGIVIHRDQANSSSRDSLEYYSTRHDAWLKRTETKKNRTDLKKTQGEAACTPCMLELTEKVGRKRWALILCPAADWDPAKTAWEIGKQDQGQVSEVNPARKIQVVRAKLRWEQKTGKGALPLRENTRAGTKSLYALGAPKEQKTERGNPRCWEKFVAE